MFELVTREQFISELASIKSASFQHVLNHRTSVKTVLPDRSWANWLIHRGDLKQAGDFSAPGFNLLILGDLAVDGFVNLNCADFDEGGFCAIIGKVSCTVFANHYGKGTIIDGDLAARDMIINAYEDSALWVTGDLKTKFFFGMDICAKVGGVADMQYGIGYCLPLNYTDASAQSVRPHHDEDASRRLLNIDDEVEYFEAPELLQLLSDGRPLFK